MKHQAWSAGLALLLTLFSTAPGRAAGRAEPDTILSAAVERGDVFHVVAVASTSKQILYQGAFGAPSVDSQASVDMHSIFRIASMTKAITSVAVMQLVEEGALGLNDPVSKYIPAFEELHVLEGFDPGTGEPRLRAPAGAVTVRHLLTHTSGFGYDLFDPVLREAVAIRMIPGISSEGDGFLAAPLVDDPGRGWHYGINTDWLGQLVATMRGKPLDEVFEEKIFRPLGMEDTHFNLPREKVPRLVSLFGRRPDGSLEEQPREAPAEASYLRGGDGLFSTPADYLRFLRALLRGGELGGTRILAAETVALMGQNHIGTLEAGTIRTADPAISNDIDLFPGSVDRFGLGFLLNTEPVVGGRSAQSLTWAGIYNTYFWIDPARDVCGLFMTQLSPFYDGKTLEVLAAFERAVYRRVDAP